MNSDFTLSIISFIIINIVIQIIYFNYCLAPEAVIPNLSIFFSRSATFMISRNKEIVPIVLYALLVLCQSEIERFNMLMRNVQITSQNIKRFYLPKM